MLGTEGIHLVSVVLIFILNYNARRIDGAEKGRTSGPLSETTMLTSELRSPPDKLSLYAKQTTKVDFVTDKLGNMIDKSFSSYVEYFTVQ